ncbi:MAG: recombination protein RecR [Paracoccaceae bacterium]|nr:MAG: recombination protein RecR [Paracoccaceae bacterium]
MINSHAKDGQSDLESIIKIFSKMPGLGPRSAQRLVFHLIKKREIILNQLILSLENLNNKIKYCEICGNVTLDTMCEVCSDKSRDDGLVCVVEDISDLWAMNRSGAFNGVFHVLGGLLSPIEGIGPEELKISTLSQRVASGSVKEIVLALGATITGQTTANYIFRELEKYSIKITSLAQGVPVGGELDYLDDSTIVAAFNARRKFE